ncbi:MAG: NHLP bacteriocin export ABC transporter permease/ATPase subunit [Lachnospiraceae bacterium]|nr:NHLP bacteriocin export ABC transporter permease/ATPase subunit [Lachnospiraceae bacterium]
MGWFDEQIKQRIQQDDECFANAFAEMVNLVSGRKIAGILTSDRRRAEDAIGEILAYYHVKSRDVPAQITDIDDILEYLLRPSGIMRRSVKLTGTWYRDAFGAMLGSKKDGTIVAIFPGPATGYYYKDYSTDEIVKVNKKTAEELDDEAICFYEPLPLRKLTIRDLLRFSFRQLSVRDYVMILGAMAITTGLGLLTPPITRYLYGTVLDLGSPSLLIGAVLTLVCVLLSSQCIRVFSAIINTNISMKMSLATESAVMMRVLSLPVSFFRDYSSGELSTRVGMVSALSQQLFDTLFSTGLSAIFSLTYIGQFFSYAPGLVVPAAIILLANLAVFLVNSTLQAKLAHQTMEERSRENGMVYALLKGVTKVKNAGAEKRAFARWSHQYVKASKNVYRPPLILLLNSTVTTAISLIGTIVMYFTAVKTGVAAADYMAFTTAFGMVSGAFTSLAGIAMTAATIQPTLKMVKPLLDAQPEVEEARQVVTDVKGGITMSHVSFRYCDNMPNVLEDFCMNIKPGQYVAIVGKTGCGKSTILRLLLGFEHPQKGAVYYDGKDLSRLDAKSLRRKIGVVLQQSGLFQGSIFSNISICNPRMSLDDAWDAAEMAGIAEDIRQMPMGMHTLISEGQGGISGGQRQRLMIARAIAHKPRILMFDEATSALDNITQKKISDSLDTLKCTRIVIAHRLSTIRHCDRIIVLDAGRIVEDGTYDELLAQNGYFAELVARQQVKM